MFSVTFELLYRPNGKGYRLPIFKTSYYTIALWYNPFWCLELAPCQYCNVRYPTWFKPNITFCRSNQIASNSVCRQRGPIPIYLFCSLIFMPSVTEIQLNNLRALFPARFAPMIWANRVPLNVWQAVITSLARIEQEKVHVVCSTVPQ